MKSFDDFFTTSQIISSAWLGEARTIGVYVSTKGEIQTDDVITHLLAIGKQVFIPNVIILIILCDEV